MSALFDATMANALIQFEPWMIYAVGIGLSGVISAWRYFERQRTQGWPEIEGTVEQYRMISPDGDQRHAKVGIAFSYCVGGEYYAGEMIAQRSLKFPRTEDEVHRLYPIGSKIRVRFRPSNPESPVPFPNEVPHKSVYFPPRDDPR
jgi:hypothetical protein